MAISGSSRLINCLQSQKEENCANLFYWWLQLLFGTIGFLGFVSYGYYIIPLTELPIILTCFFISIGALITAIPAYIKLWGAYSKKEQNNLSNTSGDVELNLDPSTVATAECNDVSYSTTQAEEVENLRKLLSLILFSRHQQPKTAANSIRPSPYQETGHHNHFNSTDFWSIPQRKDYEFPSRSKLTRTESYDSSLRFQGSGTQSAMQDCSSSSDRDTYNYTSSSDGGNSSVYGWKKKNFGWVPRGVQTMAKPNPQTILHNPEKIELYRFDRNQSTQSPPINLPEQFPALPFPKRNHDVKKSRYQYPEYPHQFKRMTSPGGSTSTSMTTSRSMFDISQCENMSRKEILKILAHLAPAISEGLSPKPKRSRKRHHKKHCIPMNMNVQQT